MANVQDGSAAFKIRDLREEKLKQKMVDLVYPVGIVVAIANDKKPAFMEYGTWEKVAEDRMLQGASDSNAPGKKIEAGLPNIIGNADAAWGDNNVNFPSGAFYSTSVKTKGKKTTRYAGYGYSDSKDYTAKFDASKSNSIYGNAETVQPAAYVVAYWQRTE